LLGLLDELVRDADLLEPRNRHQRGDQEPPNAEFLACEECGDNQPAEEAEACKPYLKGGVDEHAACGVLAQPAAAEIDPFIELLGGHAAHAHRVTGSRGAASPAGGA
jgi:hypothetical protein